MGLLLKILLFIILYWVIKGAWNLFLIYRKFHDATRQFQDFGKYNANGQAHEANNASNHTSHTYANSTTTPTGEVVEDRRTEDEINRKIFTQEEGEYVDFEEVND